MKLLVVILAVVACAAAEEVKYDFANAKPIADFPFFQEKFPQLKSFSRGGAPGRIVGGEIAAPGQFPYQVILSQWINCESIHIIDLIILSTSQIGCSTHQCPRWYCSMRWIPHFS